MESYKIEWKRSAVKELKQLPKDLIGKILESTNELASKPFPSKTRKLVGSERSFSIRIGDYRVVYSVFSKLLTIEIIRVGHRRDVYK